MGLIAPLLVLVGIFCLSFRLSINPEESRFALTEWVFSVFLFLIALNLEWSGPNLKHLTSVLIPFFLIQCGTLISQQIQAHAGLEPMENPGTLINANFGTAFSLFWIPVLADQIISEWKSKKIWASYVGAGLIALLVNIFLFESTWGYLCLGFGGLILIWPKYVWPRLSHRPLIFSFSLALIITVVAVVLWGKLNLISTPLVRDPANRFLWWKAAHRMWKSHALWGVGLGNFPSAFLAYKLGRGENTLFVHSFPLGLLAETGVLGLGAFISLLLCWLKNVFTARVRDLERWPYAAGVCTFLLFSLVSLSYELFLNLLTLFLFLALSLDASAFIQIKFRRSALIVLLSVGLFSIPFLMSPLLASKNLVYGKQQLKEGNLGEAAQAFQSAILLDPQSSEAHRNLAVVFSSESLQEAISEQKLAIQKNKLKAVLWWELGRYLEKNGNINEAIAAYKEASMLHETNYLYEEEAVRLEGTL